MHFCLDGFHDFFFLLFLLFCQVRVFSFFLPFLTDCVALEMVEGDLNPLFC